MHSTITTAYLNKKLFSIFYKNKISISIIIPKKINNINNNIKIMFIR